MLQALQDLLTEKETTMENNWKEINEASTSTCQEVLGHKKHLYKECISIKILDRIQKKKNKKTPINIRQARTGKVKAQAEYT
ncbi:unnamed protein product [Schistosoma margrebowiei]|uniref:Uncharacterized protein n=1 Tax=Schistosoma margrebowiei TaxID=48269 RepID=A0A183LBL2_9TREM|nr:unnamed protein product [Schistosoma margrebowiei]